MKTFILRRLLSLIPILLGVTFITFLIISLTPGDFLTTMSMDPQVSPERIAQLRHNFGLDRPWYVQYALYVYRLSPLQLPFGLKWPDLGYSFRNKTPVLNVMGERFVNTLILTGTAEVLTWVLAIPLGILAAMKRHTWVDRLASLGVFCGISLPEIILALLALLFAATTGWFPLGGMHRLHYEQMPFWLQVRDLAHHMILPVFVLTVTGVGFFDALYARKHAGNADSRLCPHGARERTLVEPGCIPPCFSKCDQPDDHAVWHFHFQSPGSSFLVEIIMGWPGVGNLTYEALLNKDMYVIMASLLVTTTLLILGNLFSDLMLAANDPRIRYE